MISEVLELESFRNFSLSSIFPQILHRNEKWKIKFGQQNIMLDQFTNWNFKGMELACKFWQRKNREFDNFPATILQMLFFLNSTLIWKVFSMPLMSFSCDVLGDTNDIWWQKVKISINNSIEWWINKTYQKKHNL